MSLSETGRPQIEILAPAGSPQALAAAVSCGADAVYLGIDRLNARRAAQNFTADTLGETVAMLHTNGVRVYLTLNILLLPRERQELLDTLRIACDAGVDAVIVQDMGVASVIRQCCPSLALHASTQMAVHNIEGAKELEALGFRRVVLARECSGAEIARITKETTLETEVFVHGALCMCVSGQCYMSAVFGQRSGNRGLCAQPCRLAFSSEKAEYALSLKDMSHVAHLRELWQAGVTSLKIEGRMKRPEYVAAAVTACRSAVAGDPVDLESLQSVFSRSGFTDGYFIGEKGRTLEMFGVRQKADVIAAAGVLKTLETLYTDPRRRVQKVPVDFTLEVMPQKPVKLAAQDDMGNLAVATGEPPQQAMNKPTTQERAAAAVSKTGGTPYFARHIGCEVADGLMVPASQLNAMRRDVLDQLSQKRSAPRKAEFSVETLKEPQPLALYPANPKIRLRLYYAAQFFPEMLDSAELVTLPPDALVALLEKFPDIDRDRLCAGLAHILFSGQDMLKSTLQKLKEMGIRHAGAGNLGALHIARGMGFTLHGEPHLNVLNTYAADAYKNLGLADLILSFECTLQNARKMRAPLPVGLTAYGRLPLMTVRNCPVRLASGCGACKQGGGYITDRKQQKMYTSCAYGSTEILNGQVLYAADRMQEFTGLDFVELRFTTETRAQCRQVLGQYQAGAAYDGVFTRGLLYKSIL